MKQRRLSKTEVAEEFTSDHDVMNATRMWAMGLYSDKELIEKFQAIHSAIDMNPVDIEEEAIEYEDVG
jgi:hypothetical protein